MWTTSSPFQCYSYVKVSIQCVDSPCHDKSFPAIPNMLGFHWTEVIRAQATLQLALRELQYVYVLQYIVLNTNIAHKQPILVFLLHFSVALALTQLVSQPPQPWLPPAEIDPQCPT
jgi:hypothetical protein